MIKKHKFIDTLKSWLVTLGVASVFGLAALGVNLTKTYTKTSAYEYFEDGSTLDGYPSGTLKFDIEDNQYDLSIIYNYFLSIVPHISDIDGTDLGIEVDSWFSCELNYSDDGVIYDDFVHYYAFVIYDGYRLVFAENTDLNLIDYDWADLKDDVILTIYLNQSSQYVNYSAAAALYLFSLSSYEGYQGLRNYTLSYNAPQSQGNFLSALTDFMQLLGGAIVQLAQPIANGVTEFARDLFIDNNHLSILGGVIGIFAGIALAVGITTKVYTWVTSLGN